MDLLKAPIQLFSSVVQQLRLQFAWVQVEPINWKFYVQCFLWAQWGFETYLLLRQYPYYKRDQVPKKLAADLDAETFRKSQVYGRDKARYSFVSSLYHQTLQWLCLKWDFYPKMWELAGNILHAVRPKSQSEILQSIIFVFVSLLLSQVLDLPLSVYQTFYLEQKHGFNKTTPGLFVADLVKMWVLSVVIGGPFMAAFLKVFDWAGDAFVPFLMAFMVAFQMIMIVVYPTLIQPLFNKLTPLPAGELRTRIEHLAGSLNYPLTKLFVMDGSKRSAHSNAYMYGLPWSKHIVIFDTLIEQSHSSEVEAVIAHELGHWSYNHPLKLLFVGQAHLFFILTAFSVFQHSAPLLKSFGFDNKVALQSPTVISFFIFQLLLTPTDAFLNFLINALSRRFEWQADHFAADLPRRLGDKYAAGAEKGLASMGDRLGKALVQLHIKNLSGVWVDWLFSAYHHSHPTLTERLKELDNYKMQTMGRDKKDL